MRATSAKEATSTTDTLPAPVVATTVVIPMIRALMAFVSALMAAAMLTAAPLIHLSAVMVVVVVVVTVLTAAVRVLVLTVDVLSPLKNVQPSSGRCRARLFLAPHLMAAFSMQRHRLKERWCTRER